MTKIFTAVIFISCVGLFNNSTANMFDIIDEYEPNKKVKSLKKIRNYQVVKQQNDYTCAAATLATVFNHQYGKKYSERSMIRGLLASVKPHRRALVKKTGFSLLEMKKVIHALGYRAAGYKLDTVNELQKANFPSIVHVVIDKKPHFVIVKYIKGQRVFLADPAWGNRSMTSYQFSKIWKKRTAFFILPKNRKLGDRKLINLFAKTATFPDNTTVADWLSPDVWLQQNIDGLISNIEPPTFIEDTSQPPTLIIPSL
jgi:predicted double-glycine peptidase